MGDMVAARPMGVELWGVVAPPVGVADGAVGGVGVAGGGVGGMLGSLGFLGGGRFFLPAAMSSSS